MTYFIGNDYFWPVNHGDVPDDPHCIVDDERYEQVFMDSSPVTLEGPVQRQSEIKWMHKKSVKKRREKMQEKKEKSIMKAHVMSCHFHEGMWCILFFLSGVALCHVMLF